MIPGPVEIGDAVPQCRRQRPSGAAHQQPQPAQQEPSNGRDRQQAHQQSAGEVRADAQGIAQRGPGEPCGDQADAHEDGGSRGQRLARTAPAPQPVGPRFGHLAPEDDRRPYFANAQQRGQGEQERGEDADRQTLRGGDQIQAHMRRHRKEAADQDRKRALHQRAECDAQQAAREAQGQGLRQVDLQHLARARAEAFQHGDGIHLLLQVRVHGCSHTQRAHNQRDQADEAEEGGGALQAACDDGMRLAVIGDQAFGEGLLQDVAHLPHVRAAGRKEKQEALGGAAAEADEAGAVEALAADHHARPDVDAAGQTVGLGYQQRRDTKVLAAEPQVAAHAGLQPQEQVVGHHGRTAVEDGTQRGRGVEDDLAIKRIGSRIDSLHGNQHGFRHRDRVGHSEGFGEGRAAHTALFQAGDRRGLLRGGLFEHAQREVGGHQGARLEQQQIVKGAAEGAHAREGSDAYGHRQDHEEEFGGRGAYVTPGYFKGGWWLVGPRGYPGRWISHTIRPSHNWMRRSATFASS